MSNNPSEIKYRPDIDGLRAIAVLSVVFFHCFPNSIKGGFIGVDIFFVISGYLISLIILNNLELETFSFTRFYLRRIRRILPSLLIVLFASYILGWLVLYAEEFKQLGNHIAGGAGFFSNFILWNEVGYFDIASEKKPLLHLWSLAVEEQFYIFYPIILWSAWKCRLNLLAVMLTIALVSFAFNIRDIKLDPVGAFYSPQTRFWEFMIGAMLAFINLHKSAFLSILKNNISRYLAVVPKLQTKGLSAKFLCNTSSVIGMGLLIFGFFYIEKREDFPGIWALVPVFGAFFLILAGQSTWINKKILSNRIAIWFGLISFPLYLWHWVLLSFARITENETPARNIRIAILLISIFLAWLTYIAVEKPLRFGGKRKTKALFLVFIASLVGYLGYYTNLKNGFPSREQIKKFETINYQFSFTQDLGKPKQAMIMLLGDSHAAHYVPGLKKYYGNYISDYTESGCIPFYNVDRYDNRFIQGSCAKTMNSALEYFESNNQMTGIILASMGTVYLSGETFNGIDAARVTGDGVKLIGNEKITDRWDVYAYGMRNTLSRLSKANKRILFIIDIPELGFDPRSCIKTRPFTFTSNMRKSCSVSRDMHDSRSKKYKAMIYSILKEFPNVMVYDPEEDLCDKKDCWAIINGQIIYRDADHLTNEGSNFLVERMQKYIGKL